jgi:hypothetical protein
MLQAALPTSAKDSASVEFGASVTRTMAQDALGPMEPGFVYMAAILDAWFDLSPVSQPLRRARENMPCH